MSSATPATPALITSATDRDRMTRTAVRSLQLIAEGSEHEFSSVIHPDAINRESSVEPAQARGNGPAAFWATAQWLRTAYSDMTFPVTTVVVDGDLVVTHGMMTGRHTGNFVVWTPQGRVERVFAPTGKSFEVHHAHFMRFRDGLIAEHWAVRDDQAQSLQLGWVPPTPAYLVRCAIATRRARRAAVA